MYASEGPIYLQAENELWAPSSSSVLCAPNHTPHQLRYRIFCTSSTTSRGLFSHLGLQEGHEKPSEGHASVQNAQKTRFLAMNKQERLAGASCRIQTFAGHPILTMIPGIQLGCPPNSDVNPPLGRIVPHGLMENTPHLGSHPDA